MTRKIGKSVFFSTIIHPEIAKNIAKASTTRRKAVEREVKMTFSTTGLPHWFISSTSTSTNSKIDCNFEKTRFCEQQRTTKLLKTSRDHLQSITRLRKKMSKMTFCTTSLLQIGSFCSLQQPQIRSDLLQLENPVVMNNNGPQSCSNIEGSSAKYSTAAKKHVKNDFLHQQNRTQGNLRTLRT
jgi:hypothetical protein